MVQVDLCVARAYSEARLSAVKHVWSKYHGSVVSRKKNDTK